MRKLATIRVINDIEPIDGADKIELATVDGWKVVTQKGEYSVGDFAIYCEIDSWIPHTLAPFLTKNAALPREYLGVKGERLRTIRLRGQVSQGLLLKIDVLDKYGRRMENPEDENDFIWNCNWTDMQVSLVEGYDCTEFFGIQKWEAPISAQLSGKVKGNFPSLIPKTDQERIQNCFKDIQKRNGIYTVSRWVNDEVGLVREPAPIPDDFVVPTYEVTLKLDGSSMTIFRWEGVLRVCSRNLELEISEANIGNSFVAKAMEIADQIPDGFAFQGELMGEGIQNNRENFTGHHFFVFDVFDIKKYQYLSPLERRAMVEYHDLMHVPFIETDAVSPTSVADGIAWAENLTSINHKVAEGAVFKLNSGENFSFKIISNKFLMKNDG